MPGPVPTSPANRDYQAGFTAAMMLKDLKLAQQAAQASGASTPLGAEAAQLFSLFVNGGNGGKDFSGIIKHAGRQVRPMITLYDLVFDEDRRPSPFCWRAKLALKHKGLDWRDEPMGFTEKHKIAFAESQTVSGHP